MDKYALLMDKLKNEEPFALARFNDGEMTGIEQVGSVVARGDQRVNEELHNKLKEALSHRQEDYWIGKPCSLCFPTNRDTYEDIVPSSYSYQTHATVLINNGRWWKTFDKVCEYTSSRSIVWIGGASQDLSDFRDKGLDIEQIRVPEQNSWRDYEKLSTLEFNTGEVVMLSCGPLSRVLARDYYKNNTGITVLDLGSVFDPLTRGVWFRCHTHNGEYCGGYTCEEDNFDTEDDRLVGKNKQGILESIRS